jgi:uncharacterized membrane protein
VSDAVETPGQPPELPPAWQRLERAAEEAATALPAWRRRALEAEEEVGRLHRALDALASPRDVSEGPADELRRLRAENTALRSRMNQARKRVHVLLTRLASLEVDL